MPRIFNAERQGVLERRALTPKVKKPKAHWLKPGLRFFSVALSHKGERAHR